MKFVTQTENLDVVLANTLNEALTMHKKVVWLVSGGSNVAISVAASKQIMPELRHKLVVMQLDERYVPMESENCNWQQLLTAGFDVAKSHVYPVLANDAMSLENTVQRYEAIVKMEFEQADYIIGQFGVGNDGHVAGILPETAAVTASGMVCGFKGFDFERVTLTFDGLRAVDKALVFAAGESKLPALHRLKNGEQSIEKLPARIFEQIEDSTIYNDDIQSEEK